MKIQTNTEYPGIIKDKTGATPQTALHTLGTGNPQPKTTQSIIGTEHQKNIMANCKRHPHIFLKIKMERINFPKFIITGHILIEKIGPVHFVKMTLDTIGPCVKKK